MVPFQSKSEAETSRGHEAVLRRARAWQFSDQPFVHLFPVEDEDEPGRRVAGRRAAFHFERLARLVRGSKATEGGSFLGGDRQAHVRLAEDREEIRPLRGHLAPVQPHKVHLHSPIVRLSQQRYLFAIALVHVHVHPFQLEITTRRLRVGHKPEELRAILVPLHGVQFLAVQIVLASERHFFPPRIGYGRHVYPEEMDGRACPEQREEQQ